MIIGNDFVWAHIPKTAGNSTAKMFDLFESQIIVKDPLNQHKKHDTFRMREKFSGIDCSVKRKRILNLRRLGSWTLSLAQHQLKYAKIQMNIEELAVGKIRITNGKGGFKLHLIDEFLKKFICDRVDLWFRTEFLAEDFIRVMSNFFPIDEANKKLIFNIKENQNRQYDKNLLLSFSKEQVTSLYDCCPFWSKLENDIFGNTLLDLI